MYTGKYMRLKVSTRHAVFLFLLFMRCKQDAVHYLLQKIPCQNARGQTLTKYYDYSNFLVI